MKAQETGGVRWKIRTRHLKDADMPFHEWYWTGEPVKADTLGRLNRRMWQAQWARVTCLYEECPAEALIRIADMVDLLPVLVKRRVTPPVLPTVDPVTPPSPHWSPESLTQHGPADRNLPPELLTTGSDQA